MCNRNQLRRNLRNETNLRANTAMIIRYSDAGEEYFARRIFEQLFPIEITFRAERCVQNIASTCKRKTIWDSSCLKVTCVKESISFNGKEKRNFYLAQSYSLTHGSGSAYARRSG